MEKNEIKMIALSTLLKRSMENITPINADIYAVYLDLDQSTKDNLIYYRFPVVGIIRDDKNNLKYISHGPDGPRVIESDDTFIGYFTKEDYLSEVMQEHGRMIYKKICER